EVGRLFGDNQMIVAEVLQSAEVMKAAVARLEPHMTASDQAARAKILLATVKGDVHDIGKNLVHIILKNNGYKVVDLGIKVAPETLIEAVRRERPDAIGLSGLLVKSAQQMVSTAEDLTAAGLRLPVLIGGAALSPRFAAKRIAPAYDGPVFYAKDAMSGLGLANDYFGEKREALLARNRELQEHLRTDVPAPAPAPAPEESAAPARVSHGEPAPVPPDLKAHALTDFDVAEIFEYVNPIMLYGKHLGLRGNLEQLLRDNNPKAVELTKRVRALQDEILEKRLITAKAVYRFYAANADGDRLSLYDAPGAKTAAASFDFPRQPGGERLCLSDFVRPASDGRDYVALFVVTCGAGIKELSESYREKGEYLRSHALQALAVESAEGFAELLHDRLRRMWGIGDPPGTTIRQKFQARYRGLRVSFGYPACPNLEDQAKLFALLEPEKSCGVSLTEGFMMEPEASVSALVFHHPQARYFSVGPLPAPAER
ncbi:MAG: cobalamin-dependent protein, partial [Elusimicrobia bacterium]|nr:cobalamin-dependent protein [Elusimicrobiota bacterium]